MNRIFPFLIFYFSVCSLSAQAFLPSSNAELASDSSDVSQSQSDNGSSDQKDSQAIQTLNQLFNSDESNKKKVLIINNDSDCDFTMTITGHQSYVLPVGSRKTESIIVDEGDYVLRSEICKTPYLSKKTLSENMQVNIKYSVVTTPENPGLTAMK